MTSYDMLQVLFLVKKGARVEGCWVSGLTLQGAEVPSG